MNRIDRMLATILLLQSHRVIKAGEIAKHFEISLRTVYRDIAAISEAGVPVVAEAGVGYSLLKGYSVPPVMFTAEEASALFLGGEMVEQLTDPSLQTQMRSALLKIRSVLPLAQRDHLDRLHQATALFFAHKPEDPTALAVLAQIQNALAQRRVIALDYRTGNLEETKDRPVEPMGLVYYSNHWHLIAYCRLRNDYRDFRTDRVVKMSVKNEFFPPRPGFSVRDFITAQREPDPELEVTIKFTPRAAELARRSWFSALRSEKNVPGGVLMTFPVGRLEWLIHWLLSFGKEVEVISPPELRGLVAQQALALAQHHQPQPAA